MEEDATETIDLKFDGISGLEAATEGAGAEIGDGEGGAGHEFARNEGTEAAGDDEAVNERALGFVAVGDDFPGDLEAEGESVAGLHPGLKLFEFVGGGDDGANEVGDIFGGTEGEAGAFGVGDDFGGAEGHEEGVAKEEIGGVFGGDVGAPGGDDRSDTDGEIEVEVFFLDAEGSAGPSDSGGIQESVAGDAFVLSGGETFEDADAGGGTEGREKDGGIAFVDGGGVLSIRFVEPTFIVQT